jgi:hypothetical protein
MQKQQTSDTTGKAITERPAVQRTRSEPIRKASPEPNTSLLPLARPFGLLLSDFPITSGIFAR